MENKKTPIGTYGYVDELKQKSRTNMIVYFVFAAALLAASFLIMKTMLSAFTVASIAMIIPAFQGWKQYMNVNEFTSCNPDEYTKISEIVKGKLFIVLLSDLVLSSTKGEMMLNMAVIYNNNIYGYAPKQQHSVEEIEELLTELLTEENISSKKPVVHENFDEFEEMILMLASNEPSSAQDVGRIYHQIASCCL